MKKQLPDRISGIILAAAFVVLLCSCIGGKSPAASFYTLTAAQTDTRQASRFSDNISIAIGPVFIPSEIDRPQILLRDPGNRIKLSEFDRWAAPLQENIASVLASNLSILLATDRIVPATHENLFPATHHIALNINRFDGDFGGDVTLDVTWAIQKSGQADPLIVKRSVIHQAVPQGSYSGLVAAHSDALAELSREIAGSFTD